MNFILLLLVTLSPCIPMNRSQSLNFTYPTFDGISESDFIMNNSNIAKGAIQVTLDETRNKTNQSGRILYPKPLKLWRNRKGGSPVVANFTSTFVLNIFPQVPGGEGLAFILTGDATFPSDSYGKWLGIVNSSTNGSAQNPIVAIEFDTLKSYEEDLDSNHVGLDINSIYSVEQVSLTNYGVNLSTGADITVQVQYDGANISVFVSSSPVLSVPINLSGHLPEHVYVGFSASTGTGTQLNCIRSWDFLGSDIGGEGRSLLWAWILIPVLVIVVGVAATLYLFWKRRIYNDWIEDSYPRIEDQIEGSAMAPKKFRLRQLRNATGNFNPKNELGRGGCGTVYKGCLMDRDVAVKRLSKDSRQGMPEFLAEVTTIRSLRHRNLVKLIGWCYERQELLLVYEYMPHGSLDKLIYQNKTSMAEASILNWERRYNIICGVAQALDYLHNGCERRVLHRDIKASNIMLDLDFNARLGDFGLARMIRRTEQTHHSTKEIAGTPGYMAPETFLTGRATVETDVYGFGVLMFEVVCGRRPGEQDEQNNIVYWIWELHRRGCITGAVDSTLDGESEEKERVLMLGLTCCHPNPHDRPSMRTIRQVLAGEAPTPLVPKERPPFMWPAMPPSFKGDGDVSVINGQLTPITELVGR